MYKEKSTPFANSPLYATSQKQKCFFLFQSNILNPKNFSFQNFTPPVINKILNYEAHQFVLFHSRKKPSRLAFFSFSLSVRLLKYAHTGKKYSVKCGNADLRMSESLSLSDSGHRPFNCALMYTQCSCHPAVPPTEFMTQNIISVTDKLFWFVGTYSIRIISQNNITVLKIH